MTDRLVRSLVAGFALLMAVAAWSMRVPSDGSAFRLLFVAASVLGCAVLAVLVARAEVSARSVLLGAVVLRLLFLPVQPSLSDDGYRYVWDGLVQTELGLSPYAAPPSRLADALPQPLFAQLNSPEYYSVYPPTSQLVFRAAASVYGRGWTASWLFLKGFLVLVELVGLLALSRVVSARGLLLVSWHPLALIEIAGQGHTEGLAIGFLGLTIWALARHRVLAGAALAAAGWAKLFPFLLAIPFVRRGGWRTALGLVVATIALALPFASLEAAQHVAESLKLYAGTFDFYSAPFLVLKAALYSFMEERSGAAAASTLGFAWLVALAALFAIDDRSRGALFTTLGSGLATYVVFASTLHPWHLLPALLAIALVPGLAWVQWGLALSFVTYLRYVGIGAAYDAAVWIGWGGTALGLLVTHRRRASDGLMRARAIKKWKLIRHAFPELRPGARLLDLGCGEGFVGELAALEHGSALTLADVLDFNRTARPLTMFNGTALPFPDETFDASLLVYVLHHASDPEGLVHEAMRVTAGPIVILESVSSGPTHRCWLERVDSLANRFRSGGAMDVTPPRIESVEHWQQLLENSDRPYVTIGTFGWFHKQALFVANPRRLP